MGMFSNFHFRLFIVYKNGTHFCIFILCPVTLLNLFISLKLFLNYKKETKQNHQEGRPFSCLETWEKHEM